MKTLVVNNQKGGVGKTTIAAHAAWFLAEQDDARVMLVDTDPQCNLTSTFLNARQQEPAAALYFEDVTINATTPPGITLFPGDKVRLREIPQHAQTTVRQFIKNMQALDNEFDYCVIDTPPSWGPSSFAALAVASGMLSPIDLGKYALDGTKELLQQLQLINDQIRADSPVELFGILVSKFISTSPKQRQTLVDLADQYGASVLFPGFVTQRQSYDEATEVSQPVWTMKNRAAQEAGKEIRAILTELKRRMDVAGSEDDDD